MLINKTALAMAMVFAALSTLATVAHADGYDDDDDWPGKHHPKDKEITVDCDKGQTITQAIKFAMPGDTIQVTGTCNERVLVTKDGLTFDGGGMAVLDGEGLPPTPSFQRGGLFSVDGARDVAITEFTIQTNDRAGINVNRGASLIVSDVLVQETALTGIFVYGNCTVELEDVEVRRAGSQGIAVLGSSLGILKGGIVSTDNAVDGITAFGESTVDFLGADVDVSRNGRAGIFGFDAEFHTNTLAGAGPNAITAEENGLVGIGIVNEGTLVFSKEATVTARNNGAYGLWVVGGTIVNPLGQADFSVTGNPTGVQIELDGEALFVGGRLAVQGNDRGLVADGAAAITIVGEPLQSFITGNDEADVDLSFGTRATLQGVAIGEIICDPTVLSRGSTVCP